jgi:hypothetical protein
MPDRFSLRHGFEKKPEQPVFDEAPERLRLFVLRTLKNNAFITEAAELISETLVLPSLIVAPLGADGWNTLYTCLERASAHRIYELLERIYRWFAETKNDAEAILFEKDLNHLMGEEGIGWRMEDGLFERTLPAVVAEQVEDVFAELQAPRFEAAFIELKAAVKAYNANPRRDADVCRNAFHACESVAKEVFGMPHGKFGDVLNKARNDPRFTSLVVPTLEKLSALAHAEFRHGMTEPFKLGPSEVDFVYVSCLATILLFVRLPAKS